MRIYKGHTGANERGFTILELMVATAVLSTILLLATVLIINIGNLYYKGVNLSNTQDDVRSITDQLAQDLKLNVGTTVTSSAASYADSDSQHTPVAAYCIGTSVRYTYVIGYRLGNSGTDPSASPNNYAHVPVVLWRDNDSVNDSGMLATYTGPSGSEPTGGCQPVDLADSSLASVDPSGQELISSDSRLTAFCIGTLSASGTCTSDLTGPAYTLNVGVAYGDNDLLTNPSSINHNPPGGPYISIDTVCSTSAYDRFCATANLTTTVVQRQ